MAAFLPSLSPKNLCPEESLDGLFPAWPSTVNVPCAGKL